MNFEVLVEDKSGGVILEALLNSILAGYDKEVFHYKIRPHRGVGNLKFNWANKPKPHSYSLLNLLPAKLRAYNNIFMENERQDDTVIIVVIDSDANSPSDLCKQIATVSKIYTRLPVVIGIAVEELEAWALGDSQALAEAFPDFDRRIYADYEQDSVCQTWETLAKIILPPGEAELLIAKGYPAVGKYKYIWATMIAPFLDAGRNQSPSFKLFARKLARIIDKRFEEAKNV